MKWNNPYWTNTQKIEMLQRWILFHSYLYYELDEITVEDIVYDKNAHQLVELMKNKEDRDKSRYSKIFEDYDGNTGFYLVERLKKAPKLLSRILWDIKINENKLK